MSLLVVYSHSGDILPEVVLMCSAIACIYRDIKGLSKWKTQLSYCTMFTKIIRFCFIAYLLEQETQLSFYVLLFGTIRLFVCLL